jgi:hypothetical protein
VVGGQYKRLKEIIVFQSRSCSQQRSVRTLKMPTSTSKIYPKTPQKRKNRVLTCFGVGTLRKGYVGTIN